MELDSKDPPPSYEVSNEESLKDVLEPATLVLMGQSVVSDTSDATPLYYMNWSVTSIPQKGSSDGPLGTNDATSTEQQNKHIFYLAHPTGAKYQEETPEYYLTSVSPESLGNISLETSNSTFLKTEFRMLLSPGRTWSDKPLFDESAKPLFEVKPKWIGSRYTWTDCNGEQVAYEDIKGDRHKLVITTSMERKLRDALVATWCLKLWYETAESTQAKRDAMERLTPAEAIQGYSDLRMAKRIGVLGSLGGAGA
ncbi:hypothetical protein F4781DRAFT_431145 [Annulohypoxylon bovei var. microspora]|nr:hypothetical protein F4781DRAFT_431145 [Annulohypoxylon bovei var. microspora]